MAGISWVKIETTFPRKPVVYHVAMTLEVDTLTVVGALISLLCWADGVTSDGVIGKGGDAVIDSVCGLKGLSAALINAGWLTKSDDGVVAFCEWETHNGANAKKRALDARKTAKYKAKKKLVTENGDQGYQKVTENGDQGYQKVTENGDLDEIREDKNIESVSARKRARTRTRSSASFIPTDEQALFLGEYGKQPRDIEAFNRHWAVALEEVGDANLLARCARLSVERLCEIDGGTEKQQVPEHWLADRKYRDHVKTVRTSPTARAVDLKIELPEGF
jgi:hypothetical protein